MEHTCRRDGQKVGTLDGPAWASPGEIVKLVDAEHWGRIQLRYLCCDTYEVRVEAFADQEAGTLSVPLTALENAYGAYPANMPPRGYPVPRRT